MNKLIKENKKLKQELTRKNKIYNKLVGDFVSMGIKFADLEAEIGVLRTKEENRIKKSKKSTTK
jgi:hypothetical protein